MKGLKSVVVCLIITVGLVAARPAHYSMGPAHRFEPAAGEEANFISFANDISIDTRIGEPTLPAGLSIEPAADQSQYYIVQFTGPLLQQWFRDLERNGVSTFGYLPNYAVLAYLTPDQRAYVELLPMVRWVGLFQPAYKLESGLLDASGTRKVVIMVMPGASPAPVTTAIETTDGTVHELLTTSFGTTITATLDGSDIASVARLQETFWVQEWSEATTCNNTSQWVMQGGWQASSPPDTSMAARPVWRKGVRGQGVILSTSDTGMNTGHNMFRDPTMPITPPGVWPDHRKVVAFKLYQGASASEVSYHGSHVNGSVAGNDSAAGGTSYYDGMAKDARLYFVDVTSGSGNFVIPTDFTMLWDTIYFGRGLPDSVRPIKQHSGSWRWSNTQGTYKIQDASSDAFCWAHKDFLNIIAAGNEGSGSKTLGNPSIAKNILTIGATERGTASNTIAGFSSRGPTQDNRIKPNVMAPGVDIWSVLNTGTNGYSQMSGTSMATPTANGTIGLMRCYLQEGYYPTGGPVESDRISYVSSALLRSMAMTSADPNIGSYTIPSMNIGWGRIDADSLLYFTGDVRKLIITDDTTGIATGEFMERQFRVDSAIPLRVCLAWTDTAAAPSANPTIVNDLDLTLTSPSAVVYKGNRYTSGQSTPNPADRDSINVEECARVNAPDTGTWTIRVSAHSVATARKQAFAWTVSGAVEPAIDETHDVGVTAIIAPADTVDTGAVITPRVVVQNFGTVTETFHTLLTIGTGYTDTIAYTLDAGLTDTLTFAAWTANPAGTFATRCSTELAGDENPANDAAADTFVVYPLAGISEGRSLPAAFNLDKVLPNPSSGRTSIRYGLPRPAAVKLSVYSAAGTLVRTLAAGNQNPGWYAAAWDGSDLRGRKVGTGVYLVRLEAGAFTSTRKLVVQH
ncbi:T9SS type A sorting domain-containing protein [candidate division WOR-3 bacterium]|uniref:T9SS type A sorting domain-containing protein n=1 Tax=candidate division WOR-3 bacterium TaxID=2052148 RepID=A0A937XH88_UNCW3|nr:T9SS type A sorting domain-containing protein [candidate division WOR-3 bacterium]